MLPTPAVILMAYESRAIFCSLVNTIVYAVDSNQFLRLAFFDTLGIPSLLCVLGSHLLIHLREAAEEGRNEGTSYRPKSFSAIEFEQGVELSDIDWYA